MLVTLVVASGCPKCQKQLAETRAALRTVNGTLGSTKDQLRAAELQNQRLAEETDIAKREAKAASQQLALLDEQHRSVVLGYDRLKAMYEKLTAEKPEIPNVGDVIVLPSEVDKALKEFAGKNGNLLAYYPKYGMVKLKADLTFKPGSDYVQTSATQALGQLARIINSPAASRFHVYVAGHTDDMRIVKPATKRRHPDNWYLAVHRAVAVQQVLTRAGLDTRRLGVLGFGEYHPVADNAPDRGGNKANRRVEIWIVPPKRYLTQDAQ